MKKALLIALGLALVAGTAVIAGEGGCSGTTQECLDKMAAKLKSRGWVGIEMEQNEETGALRIKRVVEGSPAMEAGFKIGDEIVGFNGMRYSEANEEKMAKAYNEMIPGKNVSYTVNRAGHEKTLKVTLGKLPETVLAQWVGGHLLEAHTGTAQAQK